MRRAFAIGMAVIMILTAFSILGTQVRAGVIIVPDDYPTIQDAIDNSVEGDTIVVLKDTYNEDLTISKGLTLLAANGTTIVGGIWIKDIHTFTAPITIENFIIDNGTSIDATHDYGIKISGDIGLADKNIVDMHIVDNTFVNCGKTDDVGDEMQWNAAIYFDVGHSGAIGSSYDSIFTGTGEICNNTIINNLADPTKSTQLGIGIRSGRNLKTSYNEINGNVAQGICHWGPVKTGSIGNYEINHNTIDLSGIVGDSIGKNPRGIWSYAPQSSVCYNTVISKYYGIVLNYRDDTNWGGASDGDNYNLTISHNVIHPPAGENMFSCIQISGNNSQVTYNEIYGSSRYGLFVVGYGNPINGEGTYCCHNTFENNYIHDNKDGIYAWSSSFVYTYDNVFHYNKIEDNTGYGLYNDHTGEVIDARYNWWGHSTGPLEVDEVGSEENPHGNQALGDWVSNDVDFIPWCASPTTTMDTKYVSVVHNPIIAFSDTIQGGVDAATIGDTISVAAGTYNEQIIINKDLILQGADGAKIVPPDMRNKYSIPESFASWDPIIFAFGGTLSGFAVSGSETVSVFIDNFEINGGNKAGPYGYVGIFYRNVDKGVISNVSIHHMFDADGEGDGPETYGILVYGDSDVTIENNEVSDFSRGGIGAIGDYGSLLDPKANIQGNKVNGNGLELEPNWWIEYGIQIWYDAGGNIIDNEIKDCRVFSPGWSYSGMGISVKYAAQGVNILNCQVTNCDIGIDMTTSSNDLIDGNTVTNCIFDGIRLRTPTNNVTVTNNICHHNLWDITTFDASDNLIQSNDIYESYYGIWIYGNSNNNDILDNDIHDNDLNGIIITTNGGKVPNGTEIHFNRIYGNAYRGIENEISQAVDATENWWGHPTGPNHLTQWFYNGGLYGPHYGDGDEVSDYVLYDDWKFGQHVATIEVAPTSLNLRSKGNYMSLKINALSDGYTMDQIDGKTVKMLSTIPAESYGVTGQSFSAKFDRAEFEDITAPGEVDVLVIGKFLDGHWFWGSDTITAHMGV